MVDELRRPSLFTVVACILLAGCGFVGWRMMASPTVLRIAVGPPGSEDTRLVAAAAQYLAREQATVRLKILPVEGEEESARALDSGKADIAVVRTDAAMPARAQTVVIFHRNAALLLAPPDRGIANVADLKGRTVGIVKRQPANRRLLDVLLAHNEMVRSETPIMVLDSAAEVESALRTGLVDAVLAIGTIGGRTLQDSVAGVSGAGGGASPVFVPVPEAEAIAQQSAQYETFDVVRGAFGGAAPRPAEPVKTLGVSHRLVAAASVEDSAISELTRLIFTMRPTLATDIPLANRIEAPESSNISVLPVHPGALAYYDGEVETFFDKYDDWIYVGIMALSVVVSAFAGLASTAAARRRARTLGLLDRLLGIVRLARVAESRSELDALQAETDEILAVALTKAGSGGLDEAGVSAFTLGLDQARHAIDERKRTLGRARPIIAQAAE